MTDENELKLSKGRSSSSEEPVTTTTDSVTNDTIASLINNNSALDINKINNSRDDNPEPLRRRSSVSIIQALVSSSHLLTTNDARKR
jgi:hypothetical protein